MEWYEIVMLILVIPVGAYIKRKIYECRRDYDKNDSCESRMKG